MTDSVSVYRRRLQEQSSSMKLFTQGFCSTLLLTKKRHVLFGIVLVIGTGTTVYNLLPPFLSPRNSRSKEVRPGTLRRTIGRDRRFSRETPSQIMMAKWPPRRWVGPSVSTINQLGTGKTIYDSLKSLTSLGSLPSWYSSHAYGTIVLLMTGPLLLYTFL